MPSLKKKLGKRVAARQEFRVLWDGPQDSGSQGGITQSLLNGYLACEERFRVKVIEGLGLAKRFNHRLGYGNMWHICEEYHAAGKGWEKPLKEYAQDQVKQFPLQQQEVEKWFNVCKVQFPVYVDYWEHHSDVKNREPIFQEVSFCEPYELTNGVAYLRGKWDSVDWIKEGRSKRIYLQENKTKGEIHEADISKQLKFDLQTMMYLIALQGYYTRTKKAKPELVTGVRYNVIRRPLSGGRGSITPHKATKKKPAETLRHFYDRLRDDYIIADPEYFFMRWKSKVSQEDIEKFKVQFLEPVLENLLDDYEWWRFSFIENISPYDFCVRRSEFPKHQKRHYRMPYGLFNQLARGGSTDLDEYLDTGSMVGLEPIEDLFPEL